jgi:hypothetical protein
MKILEMIKKMKIEHEHTQILFLFLFYKTYTDTVYWKEKKSYKSTIMLVLFIYLFDYFYKYIYIYEKCYLVRKFIEKNFKNKSPHLFTWPIPLLPHEFQQVYTLNIIVINLYKCL